MNYTFPTTPKVSKESSSGSGRAAGPSQGKQKRKERLDSAKKQQRQRVFINRSNNNNPNFPLFNSKSMPNTPQSGGKNSQPPQFQLMTATTTMPSMSAANYFGPMIPEEVMENVLFRFIYNIPDNEKNDKIRVCFHIELAHWFYEDFYCPEKDVPPVPNCKKLSWAQFARQVFQKCDCLKQWRPQVDQIILNFRHYKSNVPTYGVIMLDPTLNYILLIQGYYASKNSWGFPKGKINEGELAMECAIREALEEVGFDASEHISSKVRPLQSFIGDIFVRLYLATDVPMDFPFRPHLRKEIRKIAWFSVWDLPKDRNDGEGCARLGLQPNNFYSVHPFTNDIREFIQRERAERNKPKCSVLKQDMGEGAEKGASAFHPFVPSSRTSSNQKLSMLTPNTSTQNLATAPVEPLPSTSQSAKKSAVDNLFKPLKLDTDSQQQQQHSSFTGQTFLEQFLKVSASPGGAKEKQEEEPAPAIPKNPAGVIGAESRRRNKEIKQPKPLHPSKLIINVYEAPELQQQQSSPESGQKQQQPQQKKAKKEPAVAPRAAAERALAEPTGREEKQPPSAQAGEGGNEIVNMLRSSIGKKEQLPAQLQQQQQKVVAAQGRKQQQQAPAPMTTTMAPATMAPQQQQQQKKQQKLEMVPTQVQLCEAWKKFTFDKSCFLNTTTPAAAVVYPSY